MLNYNFLAAHNTHTQKNMQLQTANVPLVCFFLFDESFKMYTDFNTDGIVTPSPTDEAELEPGLGEGSLLFIGVQDFTKLN